jgi:hypothetical protein
VTAGEWVPTRLVAVDGTVHAWSRRNPDGRWQVRFETGAVVYPWGGTATRVRRTGVRVLRFKALTLADLRRAGWLSVWLSVCQGVRS